MAEWLAFNAFVRRAGERQGRLSFMPRGGLERGGDVLRGRGSRGEPSSEAEMSYPLEGRSATLERGGDCPAGPRGTLERGGDESPARGGCERAARWTSLSPFLSSEWEAGRGPSWAQLP